mmetsp:Transcript_64066/g.202418  ORF Transcript_64066/g.202418 Transcript_64066/m.202418 type:complete len:245 (-) Transcript_64066:439-1173(-)
MPHRRPSSRRRRRPGRRPGRRPSSGARPRPRRRGTPASSGSSRRARSRPRPRSARMPPRQHPPAASWTLGRAPWASTLRARASRLWSPGARLSASGWCRATGWWPSGGTRSRRRCGATPRRRARPGRSGSSGSASGTCRAPWCWPSRPRVPPTPGHPRSPPPVPWDSGRRQRPGRAMATARDRKRRAGRDAQRVKPQGFCHQTLPAIQSMTRTIRPEHLRLALESLHPCRLFLGMQPRRRRLKR